MRTLARSALAALVFTAVPAVAHADAPLDLSMRPSIVAATPGGTSLVVSDLELRAHDARVLRNAGIATTVIGTAVNLIGVGVLMSNLCLSDSGSCPGRSSAGVTAGFAMIGVGYGGVFAGIPMWAVGGTRLKHAKVEMGLAASGVVGRF